MVLTNFNAGRVITRLLQKFCSCTLTVPILSCYKLTNRASVAFSCSLQGHSPIYFQIPSPSPPHTQPPIQIFWGSVEEELVVYSFVFSLATDFKDVCVQLVFLKKESHPCCLCDFTFIFLFFFLSSFPSYFHLDSSWFHFFSFSYCFVFMWGFFFFYFYLFLLLILFLTDLFLEHYAGNSLMDLQLSCV